MVIESFLATQSQTELSVKIIKAVIIKAVCEEFSIFI